MGRFNCISYKNYRFLGIYNLDIIKNRTFLVLQGKCEDRLNNTIDAFIFWNDKDNQLPSRLCLLQRLNDLCIE